ncbi:uncharacterized protein C8R40DRAFT_1189658 [Lentinula edodes]|uniref:uncharacterized protein n=1 Tax=Lentinula edodes TaxID=5353 RepID=UPI001E8EC444|nr:uncharacterized protein C8R40DRAFT_1189658 [Lentinula edodes]KAH7875090.1 hypothetical protein C8R40DRAFT_1189658 [Lentinula edodes]
MQLPLRSRPTLQNPDRVHITHSSVEARNMFASWDITTCLTFNKENNANNIRRDLQRAAHLRDPENIRSPSPVTSELTIQLEEWEKIRTNPIRFDSLKHLIPDFILEWMESRKIQEVKDKREREEDTSREAEEEKKKKRRLAEPLVPVVKNPLVPFQASFHDALYEIAHVSPIPLPFFSNDALQYISARAHSLPHKKFKSNDPRKSGYFIDIEALKKMLRIKYADDDQLEGLDYILFVECVNNYMRFETSRDPAGPAGTRAQFIIQHFSFFLNKRYTAKLYAFWKPAELRIRNEQYLEFTSFIQSVYDLEWTKVEGQVEFEDTMAKARGGSLWYSYPFQSNTTSDISPPYQGSPIGDMPPLSENTITPDHTSVTNTQVVNQDIAE